MGTVTEIQTRDIHARHDGAAEIIARAGRRADGCHDLRTTISKHAVFNLL
jgi:hypothetical protein